MYRKLSIASALLLIAFASVNEARAVKTGANCAGIMGLKCDEGLWCELKAGACKFAEASGVCAAVPRVCPNAIRPVCGCDGKTYANDCIRQQQKTSKAHDGKCRI
jgi:hypothetical protein